MITGEIKQILSSYGLSDKEIKVYLSTLSLGDATVREIAKDSRLKRTTIYPIAERLVEKGILGQYKAKYGTHYSAINPRGLITRLENIKLSISSILPQLEAIENKEETEATVKFYRGPQGFVSVLDDTLNGFSYEILYFGSTKDLHAVTTEHHTISKYIPERLKRRIKFRQIVFPDSWGKAQKNTDAQELRQTKFLPTNSPISANMVIYQNKVVYFTSKKEMTSMVIESSDIANLEREKFNLLWEKIQD